MSSLLHASNSQTRAAEQHQPGSVAIESRTITAADGTTIEYELGTLYVRENRNDPKSRLIGVGFVRFRALEASAAPPMFHLPGGPGMSLITGLANNARRLAQLARYRGVADVILVDQRGFSEQGDVLRYAYRTADEPLDEPATIGRSTATFVGTVRAAVESFTGKGFDLRGYTVKEYADDVAELRKALGYEQIALVGTSFGSQWSFAIIRRHPEIVARALLSGVEPLDFSYDMPSLVFAAVERMWWEAEREPALQPYLPEGGLAVAAREVLERLRQAPVRVPVKDASGGTTVVALGHEDFQRDAFTKGAAGPAFILSAYYEHYDAWAAAVLAERRSHADSLRLIGPLIDTSLGVTPKREFLLRHDPAGEFLGHWNFDSYLAAAEICPTEDIGDDFRTDRIVDIPVVFAQGDWDTQTPLENTLYVASFFPNSRTLIAEHGGHGVLGPIADSLPGVREALFEFLRSGSTAQLPARVSLPVPKFPAPDFPPPPQGSASTDR
jgi:pimeloyl-ACP methyl ester carboxylesterase